MPSEHLESAACELVGFCTSCSRGSRTGSLGILSAGWRMGLLQVFGKVGGWLWYISPLALFSQVKLQCCLLSMPPVKDQAVGHYFEALRLNQEQSMEFVLVIIEEMRNRQFRSHEFSLFSQPSIDLPLQSRFCTATVLQKQDSYEGRNWYLKRGHWNKREALWSKGWWWLAAGR